MIMEDVYGEKTEATKALDKLKGMLEALQLETLPDDFLLIQLAEVKGSCKTYFENIQFLKTKINEIDVKVPCMMCRSAYRDVALHPCKHDVTCNKCSQKLKNCPFCKTAIREVKMKLKQEEFEHILVTNQPSISRMNSEVKYTENNIRTAKLIEVFNFFDADNSGYIDKVELTGFMSKFIYKGAALAEADVKNALELVDDDKDGQISPEDFLKFMQSMTTAMSAKEFNNAMKDVLASTT